MLLAQKSKQNLTHIRATQLLINIVITLFTIMNESSD